VLVPCLSPFLRSFSAIACGFAVNCRRFTACWPRQALPRLSIGRSEIVHGRISAPERFRLSFQAFRSVLRLPPRRRQRWLANRRQFAASFSQVGVCRQARLDLGECRLASSLRGFQGSLADGGIARDGCKSVFGCAAGDRSIAFAKIVTLYSPAFRFRFPPAGLLACCSPSAAFGLLRPGCSVNASHFTSSGAGGAAPGR